MKLTEIKKATDDELYEERRMLIDEMKRLKFKIGRVNNELYYRVYPTARPKSNKK